MHRLHFNFKKMTHTYQLTGMTCAGCEAKVKSQLLSLADVTKVDVSKEANTATVTMQKHIHLNMLQEALGGAASKYQIAAVQHNEIAEQAKSWLETYKPILLIFAYILGVSLLISGNFMDGMRYFMGVFFLVFSFFKLLNLSDFADSYAMYDVVAKRFRGWGFIYPFVELALGVAFLVNFQPRLTNWATLIIMGVSAVGVIQSVLNKRKIQCACLGAVFNLPMSTVTIVEDLLMVAMSASMLFHETLAERGDGGGDFIGRGRHGHLAEARNREGEKQRNDECFHRRANAGQRWTFCSQPR